MKIIAKILNVIIVILGIISIYLYVADSNLADELFSYYTKEHSLLINNEYVVSNVKNYFEKTDDFTPKNRKELLNVFYTVIASKSDPFTFYCDKSYTSCVEDVRSIMSDNSLLSHINNFVHPFNIYKGVKVNYTTAGRITINVTRQYSDEEINAINSKIDTIYPILVSPNKTTTENIRSIHDYIINNVQYDTPYTEGKSPHRANTAYGALIEGYAVCGGYTDLMSIFLNRMNVSNYRISNNEHVWNYVYLDGQWYHLDLTFDDPITNNGKNLLRHDYFLISTERLKQLDQNNNKFDHVFNEEIYLK